MAASISSVTTMGFGNGTFAGTIGLVVTLGYGIGAVVSTQTSALRADSKLEATIAGFAESNPTISGTVKIRSTEGGFNG